MASLRRKLAPDPVSDDGQIAPTPDVAADLFPPAPEPAAPSPLSFDPAGVLTPSSALRGQLEALKHSEELARHNAIAASVETRRQSWLNSNPLAQEHYAELADLHRDALASNLIDTSPAYFDYLNSRLATLQPRHAPIEQMQMRSQEPPEPPPPRQRTPLVSAPVSRETSGGSYNGGYGGSSPSRIRLTQAQAEMARLSGISEREYAENLLKLNQMKADGSYMERR